MGDSNADTITIKDFTVESFSLLLRFLNDGLLDLPIPEPIWSELLDISNFYGVRDLFEWLVDHVDKNLLMPTSESLFHIGWEPTLAFCNFASQTLPELVESDLAGLSSPAASLLACSAVRGGILPIPCFHFFELWARANDVGKEDPRAAEVLEQVPVEHMRHWEFESAVAPCLLLSEQSIAELKKRLPPARDFSRLAGEPSRLDLPGVASCDSVAFWPPSLAPSDLGRETFTHMYVTNIMDSSFSCFERDGDTWQRKFSVVGGLFECPASVAVSPKRKEVFVCDLETYRVVIFDLNGQLLRSFGTKRVFLAATVVCVDDSTNQVHVCDWYKHCSAFTTEGELLFEYKDNHLLPECVCAMVVDESRHRVAVACEYDPHVFIFNASNGELISKIECQEVALEGSKDLRVDCMTGLLLVNLHTKKRVVVMDWDGRLVGCLTHQLKARGMSVSECGKIYLTTEEGVWCI